MTDELKNYIQRHRNWQDRSIDQLSTANNFLLTISTGLFAYIFNSEKEIFSKITLCTSNCSLEPSLTYFSLSFVFFVLSILTGILLLLARLYDFRITRHITLIRLRFYKENESKIVEDKNAAFLPDEQFNHTNFCDRLQTIYWILFKKIDFFDKSETKTSKPNFDKKKFKKLQEFSFKLGAVSWKWTKMQGLYILIGILFYSLFLLAK